MLAPSEYDQLISKFGLSRFDEILGKIEHPHPLMKRGIIFAHRDYQLILNAMQSGSKFSVLSGFMPSGPAHLGHMVVMQQLIWYQQRGAEVYVPIADLESLIFRGIPLERGFEIGLDYILSLIALGFKPDGKIYFQSRNQKLIQFSLKLGTNSTLSEIIDIYGFKHSDHISEIFYPLIDVADILYPQLEHPIPTLIPVGIDQDPHIRLSRDLASKLRIFGWEKRQDHFRISLKHPNPDLLSKLSQLLSEYSPKIHGRHLELRCSEITQDELVKMLSEFEFKLGFHGFYPPCATYHKLMPGLTGGKMSSSIPKSYIALSDDPSQASRKMEKALTGGRKRASDQLKSGGNPDICSIYQIFNFCLIESDSQLIQIRQECLHGSRLCGDCKKLGIQLIQDFLREHSELRSQARDLLPEYGIELG